VLEALQLFPEQSTAQTKVMVAYFGEKEKLEGLRVLGALRKAGISSEIYPEPTKIKKQFNYADKKNIPYVIVIGSEEMEREVLTLKSMKEGKQDTVGLEKAIALLQ
jgi:histidyl-tRNA synthetase